MHERCHEHKFVNIRKQNLGSFSSFTRRLKKSTNTQKNIKIQHLCKNLPSDPNIRPDPEKKIEKIHWKNLYRLWRAAAPGLQPLRLLRALQPRMIIVGQGARDHSSPLRSPQNSRALLIKCSFWSGYISYKILLFSDPDPFCPPTT